MASASLSSAMISGFSAPAYLAAGRDFTFNLTSDRSMQPMTDVVVMWGYRVPTEADPTGLKYEVGSFPSSVYLGPDRSNTLEDVVVNGVVPKELGSEEYFGKAIVMEVAVTTIGGLNNGVITQGWNATLRVERELGTLYVKSGPRGWYEGSVSS